MHPSPAADSPSIGVSPIATRTHADTFAAAPPSHPRPRPDLSTRWASDIDARLYCAWRADPPIDGKEAEIGASPRQGVSDRAPAAHFSLDSHHLAILDRFVARARRHARRSGRPFTGVVIEIDQIRSVSVHAAGLDSLVLKDPLPAVRTDSEDACA
jgi:hypothetical protein